MFGVRADYRSNVKMFEMACELGKRQPYLSYCPETPTTGHAPAVVPLLIGSANQGVAVCL